MLFILNISKVTRSIAFLRCSNSLNRLISPCRSILSTLTIAFWYSSVDETSRPLTLDIISLRSFIVLSSGICFSIECHLSLHIWTIFYNKSSSIFFIASEYCMHSQDGIIHLPRFRSESLSVVSWASSVWWHLVQFMNLWFETSILRDKNCACIYFRIFKFHQYFICPF